MNFSGDTSYNQILLEQRSLHVIRGVKKVEVFQQIACGNRFRLPYNKRWEDSPSCRTWDGLSGALSDHKRMTGLNLTTFSMHAIVWKDMNGQRKDLTSSCSLQTLTNCSLTSS